MLKKYYFNSFVDCIHMFYSIKARISLQEKKAFRFPRVNVSLFNL